MLFESFMHLVKLLEHDLQQNDCKSMNSCGQLAKSPPHILGWTGSRDQLDGVYHGFTISPMKK